jgi:hypothetical protein
MYCAYVIVASDRDTFGWYGLPFVVDDDEIGAWRGALFGVIQHDPRIHCRCGEARQDGRWGK